jgi:hypothetical protein
MIEKQMRERLHETIRELGIMPNSLEISGSTGETVQQNSLQHLFTFQMTTIKRYTKYSLKRLFDA